MWSSWRPEGLPVLGSPPTRRLRPLAARPTTLPGPDFVSPRSILMGRECALESSFIPREDLRHQLANCTTSTRRAPPHAGATQVDRRRRRGGVQMHLLRRTRRCGYRVSRRRHAGSLAGGRLQFLHRRYDHDAICLREHQRTVALARGMCAAADEIVKLRRTARRRAGD
jgi:hypothetical protein